MIKKELFKQELLNTEYKIYDIDGVSNGIFNAWIKSQKSIPITYGTSDFYNLLNIKNPFLKFIKDWQLNEIEISNILSNEKSKSCKIESDLSFNNFINKFPEGELLYIADTTILITDQFIISKGNKNSFLIFAEYDFDLKECHDLFVKTEEKKNCILYAYIDSYGGIETRKLDPKVYDKVYYNSDFPMDRMKEIMESDGSELVLFYGIPGGGKSSSIKSLPALYPDKQFIYIDTKVFSTLGQEGFTEFIFDHEGAVFIFEDCEEILESRETSNNPFIKALLNMTDGIFGDSIKCKFICTFNSSVDSIDKALLRKGRLSLIYEFKELEADIVKEIFKEKGIDESLAKKMSLAEAWNYEIDNGNNKKRNKIGF